jgi:hypothetical protein
MQPSTPIRIHPNAPHRGSEQSGRKINGAPHQSVQVLSILSPGEQRELLECEAVVRRGWQTFLEVGKALARIRDQKLYRAEYDTFEAYCRCEWQYAKSHAYRLIAAAEVLMILSPNGDIPVPTHEAQVRPLLGLPPEHAQLAWKKALEKAGRETVTEKLVKEAVSELQARTFPTRPVVSPRKPEMETQCEWWQAVLMLIDEAEAGLRDGKSKKVILDVLARAKKELLHHMKTRRKKH